MTKEHEIEKNYIIKAKDKTIEELKTTNEDKIWTIWKKDKLNSKKI
jgi:hypothetical protein